MTSEHRAIILVLAAVAVGWIGWIGHPLAFGVAVAFPALWARASSRISAAAVCAGYFLAASRGLPLGVANFYETDMWIGLLLWLLAAFGFVLVHTVLWTSRDGWQRPVRYLFAALVIAVPPFGIAGWAHPITAAGALFPGWGWAGLAATVVILIAVTTRFVAGACLVAVAAFVISVATFEPIPTPSGWVGMDTNVGGNAVVSQFQSADIQLQTIADARISGKEADIVVLPESAAGLWTPTVEHLWISNIGETSVLVGASVLRADGYDNVMIAGSGRASVLYRQRMPVPIAMWRPWSNWLGQRAGVSAAPFDNPVVDYRGSKIAILICYEQLLVWPVLHSMANDPKILVATGNGWWTTGTSIVPIQRATMQAWSQLFVMPLVMAYNT